MLKYTWPVFAISLLAGCPGGGKCDSGDSSCDSAEGEGEGEGEGDDTPSFNETWNSTGVTISITNGSGTYQLGMAETASSDDPWTGEDCVNGYELSDGTLLFFCHPLESDGGAFTSIYQDVVDGTRTISSLDEDDETLFSEDLDGRITYAAWSDSSGECWTWGNDTSYYTSEGCTAI